MLEHLPALPSLAEWVSFGKDVIYPVLKYGIDLLVPILFWEKARTKFLSALKAVPFAFRHPFQAAVRIFGLARRGWVSLIDVITGRRKPERARAKAIVFARAIIRSERLHSNPTYMMAAIPGKIAGLAYLLTMFGTMEVIFSLMYIGPARMLMMLVLGAMTLAALLSEIGNSALLAAPGLLKQRKTAEMMRILTPALGKPAAEEQIKKWLEGDELKDADNPAAPVF